MTEQARPPDHPVVPRPRRSIVETILAVFAVLVVGGYSFLAFTERELGEERERETVPASVRSSSGGYRSFHFWHSGYHGGK